MGAQVRVEASRDAEMLELMRRSGGNMAYVGLESINPATLAAFNKQQSVDDVKECVRRFHEHGIRVHACLSLVARVTPRRQFATQLTLLWRPYRQCPVFNVDPFTGDATVQPVGGRGKVADQRMGTLRWASRCFSTGLLSPEELHTYRGVMRFSSFRDLLRLTLSLTIGYLFSFVVLHALHRGQGLSSYPYLLFIAIFFVNLCLMILSRVVVKESYEYIIRQGRRAIKVFIYGTKSSGISLAKAIKSSRELNYKVEGFVSDDPMMIGKSLLDTPCTPSMSSCSER